MNNVSDLDWTNYLVVWLNFVISLDLGLSKEKFTPNHLKCTQLFYFVVYCLIVLSWFPLFVTKKNMHLHHPAKKQTPTPSSTMEASRFLDPIITREHIFQLHLNITYEYIWVNKHSKLTKYFHLPMSSKHSLECDDAGSIPRIWKKVSNP